MACLLGPESRPPMWRSQILIQGLCTSQNQVQLDLPKDSEPAVNMSSGEPFAVSCLYSVMSRRSAVALEVLESMFIDKMASSVKFWELSDFSDWMWLGQARVILITWSSPLLLRLRALLLESCSPPFLDVDVTIVLLIKKLDKRLGV